MERAWAAVDLQELSEAGDRPRRAGAGTGGGRHRAGEPGAVDDRLSTGETGEAGAIGGHPFDRSRTEVDLVDVDIRREGFGQGWLFL